MAQSGFTPIVTYHSTTASAVPLAANLAPGELSLNTNDGKLYFKNSSGVVTLLAGSTSGPAGGSTTQVQYNNAGVLAGITGATTNGTALTLVAPVLGTPASGVVTNLTGTASININGTVGATTPAAGAFTTLSATGNTTLGDASTDTVTVNGYMGVGGAGTASAGVLVSSTALSGTGPSVFYANPTYPATATSFAWSYRSSPSTVAAAFTLGTLAHFRANDVVKGAGSAITEQHGLQIADLTSATNNYGITSLVSSGANKWNIYASGTASNYFAGNVGIGTSAPILPLTVDGEVSTVFDNNGTALEATAVFIGNGSSASIATHARVAIIGSALGTVGELFFTNRATGTYNSYGSGIRGGYLGADARNNILTFFTSYLTQENVERMRIDAFGGVSIGSTSSPGAGNLLINGGTITTGSTTALSLATSGGTQAQFINTASTVNYLEVAGAATGNPISLAARGTDTNVSFNFVTKGTGAFNFNTNYGGPAVTQVSIPHTASANRYITLTGSNGGNPTIGTSAGSLAVSTSLAVTGAISATSSVSDSIGDVRSIIQNAKTSAYVLIATDNGKHISITTGGVTVPASIFSVGNVVTIFNNSGSNQTITQGASVTLRLAGTATTGNRTLAQYGVCTVLCVASNVFVISGGGLT